MKNKIKFKINNIEEEKKVVEMTRKNTSFFKENKIKITWPKNSTVEDQYKKENYQKYLDKIKNNWEKKNNNFLEKVTKFFNKELEGITVRISNYGPLGFYNVNKNLVTININNKKPIETIKHEIIHIFIEPFIKRTGVDYNQKEDIINNILDFLEIVNIKN